VGAGGAGPWRAGVIEVWVGVEELRADRHGRGWSGRRVPELAGGGARGVGRVIVWISFCLFILFLDFLVDLTGGSHSTLAK
jgi:hypothetical protein